VPGKYVAGARKVCRGHHGARGRRVGQAWSKHSNFDLNRPTTNTLLEDPHAFNPELGYPSRYSDGLGFDTR
jgi:hypothetical protein